MKRDSVVVTPNRAVYPGRLEEAGTLPTESREKGGVAVRERLLGQAPFMILVLITGD